MNIINGIWWVAVFFYGSIFLCYLSCTKEIIKQAKQDPDSKFSDDPYSSVVLMPELLILSMIPFSKISKIFAIPLHDCYPILQVCICCALWISVCVCATIQKNAICGIDWRTYMDKRIDEFLAIFINARRFLLTFARIGDRLSPLSKFLILIGGLMLAVALLVRISWHPYLEATLLLVILFTFALFLTSKALHSCRGLLLSWLCYGFFFAGAMDEIALSMNAGLATPTISYLLFTLTFSLLWILLAGAADRAPAKMGCAIINSLTTISLVAIQVLCSWAKTKVPIPTALHFDWGMLQDFSVVVLLPLVIAGYLAALVIELQAYWTEKKADSAEKPVSIPSGKEP